MSLLPYQRAALNAASRPPGSPSFWNAVGTAVRGIGRALDSYGVQLQESCATVEKLPIPTTVVKVAGKAPVVAGASFVAPSANLVGAVHVGSGASVWYSSMLMGGASACELGELSAVSDRAVVVGSAIGKSVNVGAGAIVRDAKVGDHCSVGMGALVNAGASMGAGSALAAGSVLAAKTAVPAGQLWGGNPAVYLSDLGPENLEGIERAAELTCALAKLHAEEAWKDLGLVEQEHDDYKREGGRTPDYISSLREDPKWVPLPTLGEYLSKIGAHSNTYTPP